MATLQSLLTSVKSLTLVQQRFVGAMVGACVADAATEPLHWIYKQETLDAILKTVEHPEFFPESKCPFYVLPLGSTSSYNDILKCTLFYLDGNDGAVDTDGICAAFKKRFTEGSDYVDASKKRKEPGFECPVHGPWIQSGVKKMLEDLENGRPFQDEFNMEYDGFLTALPLVAKHIKSPSFKEEMRKVMAIMTTNEEALSYFHADAVLIEGCILGSDDPILRMKENLKEVYPSVLEKLKDLESNKDQSFVSVVAKYGKACATPGSFLGSYLAMISSSTFVDAVRLNITAGGDNCSRANVIGAYFGGRYGLDGIPLDWMARVTDIEKVMMAAINVAKTIESS